MFSASDANRDSNKQMLARRNDIEPKVAGFIDEMVEPLIRGACERGSFTTDVHSDRFNDPMFGHVFVTLMERLGYSVDAGLIKNGTVIVRWADSEVL